MSDTVVLLVGGHAGVGKTTLARHIAKLNRVALIDKDSATRPLVDVLMGELTGVPGDRYSPEYLSQVRGYEYDCMMSTAMDIAENGVHVAVVAPFLQELTNAGWMRTFREKCEDRGYRLATLWVDYPPGDEHRRRIIERGAERDLWKMDHWDEFEYSLILQPVRDVMRVSTEGVTLGGMPELAREVSAPIFAS